MKETTTSNRREFLVRGAGTAGRGSGGDLDGSAHGRRRRETGNHPPGPDRLRRKGERACGVRSSNDDSAVSIGWLCDVNPGQIEAVGPWDRGDFQSTPPQRTSRYEDVLADKNVDAVIIATPHHWHAPIGVAALAAGKDAYIEKPISHVYNEGPQIIAAAKKYGRVVQQGTQMRSSPVTLQAEKLLREGIIGEVKVARAWTAELRHLIPPVADSAVPAGVDWDRWLGPAPKRPFNRQRFSADVAILSRLRQRRDRRRRHSRHRHGAVGTRRSGESGQGNRPRQPHDAQGPVRRFSRQHERDLRVPGRPAAGLRELPVHRIWHARVRQRQCLLRYRRIHGVFPPRCVHGLSRQKGRKRSDRDKRVPQQYRASTNTWTTSSRPCERDRRRGRRRKSPITRVRWSTWEKLPSARAASSNSIPQSQQFVDCDEANKLLTKSYRCAVPVP